MADDLLRDLGQRMGALVGDWTSTRSSAAFCSTWRATLRCGFI